MLFSAVHYPTDYGFIPEPVGEDGDPLDALVLVGESMFSGCVIRARPVGLFEMSDEKGPDAKVLAVPDRRRSRSGPCPPLAGRSMTDRSLLARTSQGCLGR
jgi:inorganic pyrophosphatase